MHDDEPGDAVHDDFAAIMFGDTPLGRPILGTVETIEGIERDAIDAFYRSRYLPQHMVVAAAGNLDHDRVVELVAQAFAEVLDPGAQVAPARPKVEQGAMGSGVKLTTRATEQANLVLGVPGLIRSDERKYALAVLTSAFGGGMSSRLFQEIREKRGLAYSVYAYSQGFSDSGLFGLYVGCLPGKVDTVLEVCREQLGLLAADGLADEEIARGKGQVRGATVLGQEDTGARMTRIAKSELHDEPLLSIGELLDRVDAVTSGEIRDISRELLSAEQGLAIVGPFNGVGDLASV